MECRHRADHFFDEIDQRLAEHAKATAGARAEHRR